MLVKWIYFLILVNDQSLFCIIGVSHAIIYTVSKLEQLFNLCFLAFLNPSKYLLQIFVNLTEQEPSWFQWGITKIIADWIYLWNCFWVNYFQAKMWCWFCVVVQLPEMLKELLLKKFIFILQNIFPTNIYAKGICTSFVTCALHLKSTDWYLTYKS